MNYPEGGPGKSIPIHLFSTGTRTLSITYCTPYKVNQLHADVHIKRKWGAWALTATSNFPGTSGVKGGQISESAQACYVGEVISVAINSVSRLSVLKPNMPFFAYKGTDKAPYCFFTILFFHYLRENGNHSLRFLPAEDPTV